MSLWPGTPKSQQSPKINVPSVRFPNTLNENSSTGEIVQALRTAFNGLTVHEQAFANLPAQISSQATTAATAAFESIQSENVSGVTSFNTKTGAVLYFPGLGFVNNQLGNTAYQTQLGDAGKKIIVGDSSPVTVTLNPSVMPPWFTFIGNDSSATATLVPGSPATLVGQSSIMPGGFAWIYYDGSVFWSEGSGSGGSGGTVTSVALTVPARQSVSGSPITISGTLAITDNTESANTVFAGPSSGGAATPGFRTIVSADLPGNELLGSFGVTIDGAGSVPGTGQKGYVQMPYAGTITGWTMLANQSGSAQITVSKGTYSAFPTLTSIDASLPPNLSSAQKNTSTTLTGWTTAVNVGDVFGFNLDSVTTCTRIQLFLQVTKS